MHSVPISPPPATTALNPGPVMGYAGRRVQLLARPLAPPRSATPFFDVDHVLSYLPVLRVDADHPGVQPAFERDRDALIATIHAAHEVFLSPGGGLLAYKSGTPQRWRIIHACSGATLSYFGEHSLGDPRPWTRLSYGVAMDLSDRAMHDYVDALEGAVDPRGRQIDWTATLDEVAEQIQSWQDYDATGLLPRPGGGSRFGALRGLELAAVLHAISPDPLREAASGAVSHAVTTITGQPRRLWIRGRNGARTIEYLYRLDAQYNHGRRRAWRERDCRTPEDLRDDRETGKVITVARLLAVGGEPHRAVAMLRERAELIQPTDTRRKDGAHSSALVRAAQMIAELNSPAANGYQRLREARVGQVLVEAASRRPGQSPPYRVWRVTAAAQQVWTDSDDYERYQLGVHELTEDRAGTLCVRPGETTPIGIDYEDGRWPDSLELLAADWVLLEAGEPVPATSQEVLDLAAIAMHVFDADSPT